MIKSVILSASIILMSSLSFGQTGATIQRVDFQPVQGCSRPIMKFPPARCTQVAVQEEENSEDVLDITDPDLSGLIASPNPTKGHLTVSVPASLIGYTITVLDMTGRFVGNPRQITGTTENLTIEGESGVYLIVIRTEKEVITERILLDTE